jgi:Ca2+-binding RTX toxin-like protein
MSEAPAPISSAAGLYPADGGAAAAAAAQAATTAAPSGVADTLTGGQAADSVAAPAGADTLVGGQGNDSISGGSTETGTEAGTGGNDSIDGGAGNDSITADSYTFTLPEGFTEDAALTTDARAVMLEAGVKPEKAQALIDLFGKAVKASTDRATAAHQTEQQTWLTEIGKMPEFQGPTRETSLQAIGRLFDEYGTPEAKAALDRNGTGNNPALVKMMHKIATVLTEGAPAPGGRPAPHNNGKAKPATVGQSLYPDS